ncbi:hypothetical protein GE21DRAFT_1219458, partial [Neurospora crassa]
NFNVRNHFSRRSSFLIKYNIMLNRITITTLDTLINIKVDTYIIINLSFVQTLRKLLKLPIYNDFNPGYVTPYKKSKPDFIEVAFKGYIKIQNYKVLN